MSRHRFVVCVSNDGMQASLELRKLYRALPDEQAASRGQIRVIDESGEDYLYSSDMFLVIELPDQVAERVLRAA